MTEDIAITSSKSDVDPCSHGRETDRQKSADGQTDRQTDGFSALYSGFSITLFLISAHLGKILSNRLVFSNSEKSKIVLYSKVNSL